MKYSSRFVFLSTPEEHSDHPDEFTTEEFLQKVDKVLLDHGRLLPVPAGRKFWSGRLTGNPADVGEWNTASELGPPPREYASNNRMSPTGISMFYGSDDIATAVAEIGAHSAETHAVLGRFETTRDLTLLNLTDLPPIPSLYTAAGRTPDRYDLTFLHEFATDLGKPIAIDDRVHIEYVPTQVISEYLRVVLRWSRKRGPCTRTSTWPPGATGSAAAAAAKARQRRQAVSSCLTAETSKRTGRTPQIVIVAAIVVTRSDTG